MTGESSIGTWQRMKLPRCISFQAIEIKRTREVSWIEWAHFETWARNRFPRPNVAGWEIL